MYIKSIVLDGFKSYGNRVEITGFDPEFNAITGLNGTGKSNILDSICFVLGITNLSNVRAGSLQELIYKHGQAGITKATVSITFDNRDKRQSPIGYDNHDEITVTRQVAMGGKNKYLINGINVQNKRVSDLFCSVQLNVNNPHFLIMQGMITKVLNMKPPEILSMVEEAAGTMMYETKKQAAEKIIEKKDSKLSELNDIIREDIAPKLQKLHDERTQFQEYQKVVREHENLTKLYFAWKFVKLEQKASEADGKVREVQDEIKDKADEIIRNNREANDLDTRVDVLNRALDEENGSVLRGLEAELQELDRAEAAANGALKASREALLAHEKRAKLLQRALADDAAALTDKRRHLHQISDTFESLRTASETSEAALAEAQQRYLAISTGREGDSESLQDQLIAAKQEASEASTRIAQSAMERKHAEQRLRDLEREFGSSSAQYQRDQDLIASLQGKVDRLREELAKVSYSEEEHARLKQAARALTGSLRGKRDALDALAARLQRCQFHYQAPQHNFDRARVAGTICQLFTVADPIYCTALEATAGAKLYNVVVDTEVTGKLLLQHGNLQARTSFIPLNKISAHVLDQKTLRAAKEIGGGEGNVQLALDVVQFEARLRPAMGWVFGNTLICRDMETAKRVAFHPRVKRRCVTLDGDVFDPAGTVSGGARARGGAVLLQIQELKDLEQEVHNMEAQLTRNTNELNSIQQSAERFHSMQQRYEEMSHELQVVRERLATTAHAQLHAEIGALRNKLSELTAAVEADKVTQRETTARARELEVKVRDIKGHREREFARASEALKKAKRDAEHHSSSWRQREQELETLRLEVSELEQAVAAAQAQARETADATETLQQALQDARQEHEHAKEAVREKQAQIREQKAEIRNGNSNIARLIQSKEELRQKNNEIELHIKELEFRIKELQTEAVECQKQITATLAEQPWIASERAYFGLAGGMYDWEAREAHAAGARLHALTERRDRLSRGLNARAHTLLAKEEDQYQDVLRKKEIVEADRAKILAVMAELDAKKKDTLLAACQQVNKDFGSIFSTLLPGAEVKLQPPPGLSVLDGLEVKVGFNGRWKESLSELSGGQRSLIALSLVLAMLLFKPAPLYILDEVDAALDLSHTQYIGQMLRQHFKHSQFIIVSLKEGMFNNANVLFQTRFVDGMSSVKRTTNQRGG